MDNVAIALEHVDLLNCLDGLDVHLLECRLQLLVVCAGRLVGLLDLSSWGSLSSVRRLLSVYVLANPVFPKALLRFYFEALSLLLCS